jgi:hypothetical protein
MKGFLAIIQRSFFASFAIYIAAQRTWDSASLHEGHVQGILEGRLTGVGWI